MDKELLKAKARGITISIEKMNEKQRLSVPSGQFGEDYNRLLTLVTQACPTLVPLLPPPVDFYEGGSGRMYTNQSFGEIDNYCEQLFQLLSTNSKCHESA